MLGQPAEHLVTYKLLRWGWQAIHIDGKHPFDIIAYKTPKTLIKIQVKSALTTNRPNNPGSGYRYSLTRGSRKKKTYEPHDAHLFALVALDIERIVLRRFKPNLTNLQIPTHEFYSDATQQTLETLTKPNHASKS